MIQKLIERLRGGPRGEYVKECNNGEPSRDCGVLSYE